MSVQNCGKNPMVKRDRPFGPMLFYCETLRRGGSRKQIADTIQSRFSRDDERMTYRHIEVDILVQRNAIDFEQASQIAVRSRSGRKAC